jgi:hypothetical protein
MGHGCDAHEELASRARSCREFQGSVHRLSQRSRLLGDGRSRPIPAQKGRAIAIRFITYITHPLTCACVSCELSLVCEAKWLMACVCGLDSLSRKETNALNQHPQQPNNSPVWSSLFPNWKGENKRRLQHTDFAEVRAND